MGKRNQRNEKEGERRGLLKHLKVLLIIIIVCRNIDMTIGADSRQTIIVTFD